MDTLTKPHPFLSPCAVPVRLRSALRNALGSVLGRVVGLVVFLTAAGIAPGQGDFKGIRDAVNVGGKLFFGATRASGHAELWILENGKAPARLVKDIHEGPKPSRIHGIVAFGGSAVFVGDDGAHGAELWRSDGTAGGTSMILEIKPGAEGSGIDLRRGALVAGRTLYFFAAGESGGLRLARTDGSKKGTQFVKSFPDAISDAEDRRMTLLPGGAVVFQIRTAKGRHVWRTDGTAAGTARLSEVQVEKGTGPFGRLGDRVFFAGGAGDTWDLWLTDGSSAGTKKLHGAPAAPVANVTKKDRRLAMIHFKTYCVTCHGAKGRGKGPAAVALNPKPRNWTDPKWQSSVTDDRLLKVIRDGGASVGLSPLMAPNPMYQKNPAVMQALVDLVRSFNGKK